MSRSASFQRVKKSWYAVLDLINFLRCECPGKLQARQCTDGIAAYDSAMVEDLWNSTAERAPSCAARKASPRM